MSSPRSRIVFNSPSLRTRLFCKSAGTSFVIVSPVFWSLTTIIFFVAIVTFIWRVFLSIVYVSSDTEPETMASPRPQELSMIASGAPEAIIESSWGLGEAIVSDSVSLDTYTIDRKTRQIKVTIATKKIMVVKDQKTGETITKEVPADLQNKRVLSDGELNTILDLGELIEEHYESPQDIEFAIENGEVFIVQSRPVTTIKSGGAEQKTVTASDAEKLLEGLGASPGQVSEIGRASCRE